MQLQYFHCHASPIGAVKAQVHPGIADAQAAQLEPVDEVGQGGAHYLRAPGERVGNLLIVRDGVQPGERVIVEGLQKARPGTKVAPATKSSDQGSAEAPASEKGTPGNGKGGE